MSNVINIGDGWSPNQVHRNTGRIVPVENVMTGAVKEELEEILIVGRKADGSVYVAGSHNSAYMLLLAAVAQRIIVSGEAVC